MARILHHIDVWDGDVIPDEFVANAGLYQRCDPIESNNGKIGLRYYFIQEVPDAD